MKKMMFKDLENIYAYVAPEIKNNVYLSVKVGDGYKRVVGAKRLFGDNDELLALYIEEDEKKKDTSIAVIICEAFIIMCSFIIGLSFSVFNCIEEFGKGNTLNGLWFAVIGIVWIVMWSYVYNNEKN